MARPHRVLSLILAVAPLLAIGPFISFAGSLSDAGPAGGSSGISDHLGAVLLVAAVISLAGSIYGFAAEPRPWSGWRIWPYAVAAPAAILLAGIWWLYFGGRL